MKTILEYDKEYILPPKRNQLSVAMKSSAVFFPEKGDVWILLYQSRALVIR